jgi:nitronate monooxygenase
MDTELVEFLNTLGEAERAGGRVLHELEQEAASLELKELLRKTAHDEGYYAGQIGLHIRRMGGEAATAMGDFVEKVRALGDLKSKIELLNRGQRWVIRKIEERLPSLGDEKLHAFLLVMAKGHYMNIQAVDEALKSGWL